MQPDLQEVQSELVSCEAVFQRPDFNLSKTDFECMLAEEFWEIGASGKRYSRQFVLDLLEQRRLQREDSIWQTTGFECRQLGPDTWLLTYTLTQNAQRLTRRASIWQRIAGEWKILYHQGTLVQASEP
jgi:hypothetical protein